MHPALLAQPCVQPAHLPQLPQPNLTNSSNANPVPAMLHYCNGSQPPAAANHHITETVQSMDPASQPMQQLQPALPVSWPSQPAAELHHGHARASSAPAIVKEQQQAEKENSGISVMGPSPPVSSTGASSGAWHIHHASGHSSPIPSSSNAHPAHHMPPGSGRSRQPLRHISSNAEDRQKLSLLGKAVNMHAQPADPEASTSSAGGLFRSAHASAAE